MQRSTSMGYSGLCRESRDVSQWMKPVQGTSQSLCGVKRAACVGSGGGADGRLVNAEN